MDLTHTSERAALAESVRAWAAREWPTSVVRELQASPTGFDARRWKQVRELGWTAIAVPEERGGLGGGSLDLVVLVEELGRAAAGLPLAATVAYGVLPALWSRADLAGLVSGETIAVPASLETDGRTVWPPAPADRDGDGWRLAGAKTLVPFAEVADLLMVTTRLDGPGDALVALPAGRARTRRLRLPVGDPVYRVDLDGTRVTAADLVATGPAARELQARATDVATLLACGYTVGLCETALRLAVHHAKERVQFGRPIGAFQSVANRCADMRVQTDAFRWLTYEAAWTLDQGRSDHDDAALAVATAKAYGDLTVRTVTRDAHQVLAGMGISTEHDLHLFTRRARTFEQTGGGLTGHLHRVADLIGL